MRDAALDGLKWNLTVGASPHFIAMSIRVNDHHDSTGSSLDSVPRRSFAKTKYRFARELGKGQFGTAMLVRGDDGALFVVKRLKAPVSVEPSTTGANGDLLRRRPTL